jgi:hypothetical protein
MNAMGGGDPNNTESGPMWGRFFDSIGQDEEGSVMSGSHSQALPEMRSLPSIGDLSHVQQSPFSEVHPNDSASVVDDDRHSALESYANRKGIIVPSGVGTLPVDDGTYVFKFRTPSGRTHRFQSRHDDVAHLREIISGKLATDPFFTEWQSTNESDFRPDPIDFHLSYTDADGDTVLITSDSDVSEAVGIARKTGSDRVVLFVQGGRGWVEAGSDKSEAKAAEVAAAAQETVKEVEKTEATIHEQPEYHAPPPTGQPIPQEDIFGIPRDLVLPASIGALAVVIVGIFTISRLASRDY